MSFSDLYQLIKSWLALNSPIFRSRRATKSLPAQGFETVIISHKKEFSIFIRWRPSSDWWICHSASAYIWTSNYVLLIHHNLDYLIAKQNFQTQNLKLIKNWQKVSPKLLKFWKIIENTLNIENNRTDSQMICNKILTKFATADLYTLEKTVV